jgi:dTDP-4-amino-4,6-dideoxygalactose transaminase
MAWRIPLFDTRFDEAELEAVQRPLKARWLTMGEEVLKLEEEIKAITRAADAIACSNGTAALQLAAAALGIGPGAEVLCPTLTFVASANAPKSLGADIRLIDSASGDDLTIDVDAMEAAITDRTRAIVVVHYAGFPCRMDRIMSIANARGIPVIEDCAHALFTNYQGKMLGLHGRIGCFSFYSNKNATCGEGGALLTNDVEMGKKLRLLRSHGMTVPTLDRHKGIATSYDVVLPGYNARLDEIRAALMRVQLTRLPGFLARRRERFSLYAECFKDTSIRVPFANCRFAPNLEDTAIHIMPVLLPKGVDRATVMARLKENGIQTSIHYPLIHRFAAYCETNPGLERTAEIGDRELTLPFYPAMSEDDVRTVVSEVLKSVEAYSC